MTRCAFRNVQTGERVCLLRSKHDCEVNPRTHRVRDAVLVAWIAAWAVAFVLVLPLVAG